MMVGYLSTVPKRNALARPSTPVREEDYVQIGGIDQWITISGKISGKISGSRMGARYIMRQNEILGDTCVA
jgi:hypothetical protein